MTAILTADALPELVIDRLADQLTGLVRDHTAGHCVRVDNVRRSDAEVLVTELRTRLPAVTADVYVLADTASADDTAIPAERAVELRNRKRRPLVLVVPVGAGAAASSLDNSFARVDITELLAQAGEKLVGELEDGDLVAAVRRVARTLGQSRPVEAWARYLAAVVAAPDWQTLGGALWRVGLVPDLGGAELVERLARNVACVRAISRPGRPVASVTDRLTTAGVRQDATREALSRFFADPEIDLSDASSWAEQLGVAHPGVLTFERWPLVEQQPVDVDSLRIEPFLKEDGTLRAGTRLKQSAPGELPYAEAGPDVPASVTLVWRTDPVDTAAVHRWLLEAWPPEDLRSEDTEPIGRQLVKGDKRRATVRLPIDEEELAEGALLVLRVTGLDADGQPVWLRDGADAVEESQQFAVRWEVEPVVTGGRRATSRSLPQARLLAAAEGQNDLAEDAPGWSGGAFSLRLGGKRTVQLALSPALVALQRRALAERGRVVAWEAAGQLGEVLESNQFRPAHAPLPYGLAERRRRLFDRLRERHPREVVETLDWAAHDGELREEVIAYCQSYRRALDAATSDSRAPLLALDTLTLNVATAGHSSIGAVLVLPLHPMRLAWAAEHDATLNAWTAELTGLGRASARRRHSVDLALVDRVTPANLPFAVYGIEGSPFVYIQEATLGTGVYLHPGEAEPGAAVQAVFEVLGLDRRDVTPELPPTLIAERISAYRAAHPGTDDLRLITYNAGSGELLAQALDKAVLRRPDGDDELASAPPRVEITAYSRRPSHTDPVPALTDLQGRCAAQEVRGTRSYLTPPLGISIRKDDRLAQDRAAAHMSLVSDVVSVRADVDADGSDVAVPNAAASFRNLLTPATSQRVGTTGTAWRAAPAVRVRNRTGAAEAVEAHRAYQAALADQLGQRGDAVVLHAALDQDRLRLVRAAHERADWVITLDRYLGIDHYSSADGSYVLDYAPDFLEGLGPRLTVSTTHRGEVERLLADAMAELDLATVDRSVRAVLDHLQVVSGRLALRLLGHSTLATEAVSLAAVVAYLRRRGALDGVFVVPVDAHQEVFGALAASAATRRCDVLVVRTTTRTMRIECVEVKARKATTLPAALVDEIVEQLDATASMLQETFFPTDPPRIDAELQRARLGGILRHHADRALATGLLDAAKRAEIEKLVERIEDGALVPEISRNGYVVSLAGEAGIPRQHRGVPIEVLTAADLEQVGLPTSVRETVPVRPDASAAADKGGWDGGFPDGPTAVLPRPTPFVRDPVIARAKPFGAQQIATPASPAGRVAPPTPPGAQRAPSAPSVVPPPRPTRPAMPSSPMPDGRTAPPIPAVPTDTAAATQTTLVNATSAPGTVEVLLGLDAHNAEVRWRISTDGSPHLFILGIPGQGKSVTTRRILNAFAAQGLPALVLDFHGDMAAAPAGGAAVLDAAHGLPISPFEMRVPHTRYAEAAWELAEVIGFVCGLGEIQRNVAYEGVRELYRQHGFGTPSGPTGLPTMDQLAAAVASAEGTGRGRNVAARLRPLTDFGLFVPSDAGRGFADLLRQGVVVDVHRLMEEVQLAAGAFLLRKVYREMFDWGQTRQLRLAVVLDEAHRLAKDVTLPKIMKEGRKYGVAVVVASQGVDDFHRDVLSNAGTKVAFRCNFPQSRTVAGFLRGRAGQDMSMALEQLGVGQAYVSTPDQVQARKLFMARD
jgi:DNA phosphorothioation-dependent restriction protein DptH